MQILSTKGWQDYELLDSGNRYRLERFGKYVLQRPDPQAIWQQKLNASTWQNADAIFTKLPNGKEGWLKKGSVSNKWPMQWEDISFYAELSPFKHTGVFPEQILQWSWMKEKIKQIDRQINILNLFAYTGIASLVAASCDAKVTHVDASKPTIAWARENQKASKLEQKPIRWILDDASKFVAREIKRGVKYDGIIMDPPVYGHGPNGERWNFSESFPKLLQLCKQVLSDKPLFIIINAYAVADSALMLENVLVDLDLDGTIEIGELALQEKNSERLLSTGIFGRWNS